MALPAIRLSRLNSSSTGGGSVVVYFCSISCDREVKGDLNRLFRISLDFEGREEIFARPFLPTFNPLLS